MKNLKLAAPMRNITTILMRHMSRLLLIGTVCAGAGACSGTRDSREPVDYVDSSIGNISHLLVPTYRTVHLPNSMLRMVPLRNEATDDRLAGLPVQLTGHRGAQAFRIRPDNGVPLDGYDYSFEKATPYSYEVYLDDADVAVRFAPSHRSAVYELSFGTEGPHRIILEALNGQLGTDGTNICGFEVLKNNTRAYLCLETYPQPLKTTLTKMNSQVILEFSEPNVSLRYGISYIDCAQAERNLKREIGKNDVATIAARGRTLWNDALGRIGVAGASDDEKTVFYTALYRTYERMVCISEEGRYFSAYDGRVHDDEGRPFYVDDWFWDTFRAAHPLRTILDPQAEMDMMESMVRIARQSEQMWMPVFPGVTGDSHSMNCNHGVAVIADCCAKGLTDFDVEAAYEACRNALLEKTLAPWSKAPAGRLDAFYREHGYFPALDPGSQETAPEVHGFEKRQPVAVTLGTAYDEWCLSRVAAALGRTDDAEHFRRRGLNYRHLFNPATRFFHPRTEQGTFVEPFDYRFSGGLGARDAYDENNGWIYRWEVPHNVADLIDLFGGDSLFVTELDRMFRTPLGRSKYEFYAQLPDHTGNVGQFSMANEPCLHIPYLYCYAGQPWKTQKRTRRLLAQWFRNDLMGIPGDEDGGGMSAFVVFSMMGFYPVTPGIPAYVLTSPVFERVSLQVPGGTFRIICRNWAPEHIYIQSARLNGEPWTHCWIAHKDVAAGGVLELTMGPRPNRQWGAAPEDRPLSFDDVKPLK